MFLKMMYVRWSFTLHQLIPMDDYDFNKSTARFCLLDDDEILAGGIIDFQNYPDQRELRTNLLKHNTC